MITRTINVDVKPTSREIADEIWDMVHTEQADLILALSQKYDNNTAIFLLQLSYANDVLNQELNSSEKTKIIHMFESILEYLKEDE